MRPAGDVRQALLKAACDLATPSHRPTMREMAHQAQVGLHVARRTVENMTRSGQLKPAGTRRVDYCNKPVAEYEPVVYLSADLDGGQDCRHAQGWVDLGRIVGGWAR